MLLPATVFTARRIKKLLLKKKQKFDMGVPLERRFRLVYCADKMIRGFLMPLYRR